MPEQIGEHCLGEGGGPLSIDGWHQQVSGHHAGGSSGNGGFKRRQLNLLQALELVGDQRQFQVGITGRIAMAGEVFGAAQHPFALQPNEKAAAQGAGGLSCLPPGAHVDHRIGGVVVDIANRPQYPVQPEAAGLKRSAAAIGRGQLFGLRWVALPKPRQAQRRRQPTGAIKALAHAFFHIGAEQQWPLGPVLQLPAAQRQISG